MFWVITMNMIHYDLNQNKILETPTIDAKVQAPLLKILIFFSVQGRLHTDFMYNHQKKITKATKLYKNTS